jgi:hypothetical protein
VHSVRPITEDGHAGPITHKPIIGGHNNSPYKVETQDLPELVDLWYAFNWLYFDAMHAFIGLQKAWPPQRFGRPTAAQSPTVYRSAAQLLQSSDHIVAVGDPPCGDHPSCSARTSVAR